MFQLSVLLNYNALHCCTEITYGKRKKLISKILNYVVTKEKKPIRERTYASGNIWVVPTD